MAVYQAQRLCGSVYGVPKLYFSTSRSFNNKWRLKQGLEPNPNRYGPIKVLPDYSFADGRPVPLSCIKIKQMEYQQKLCQRIVELNQELDAGLQQYYENQEQEQAKIAITQNKLKPKGAALLKKNNSSNNSKKEKTGNSLMD